MTRNVANMRTLIQEKLGYSPEKLYQYGYESDYDSSTNEWWHAIYQDIKNERYFLFWGCNEGMDKDFKEVTRKERTLTITEEYFIDDANHEHLSQRKYEN